MTDSLAARLHDGGPVILDGGLASELQRRGCNLDDPLWSAKILLETPELVDAVARDYATAGADILTTATYQASWPGLRAAGRSEVEIHRLFQEAVDRTRAVARGRDPAPWVAASLGPYGAWLADGSEYHGRYAVPPTVLRDFHRRRLADVGHADLLAFETIPSSAEAEAIVEALADEDGPPALVSFSCRDDAHVSHGETIEACVEVCRASPRVVAIGVNCFDPAWGLRLVERLAGCSDRAVAVYPHAGERYEAGRFVGAARSPSELADLACRWVDAGAQIVGGCCRTGPDHIRALVCALRAPR